MKSKHIAVIAASLWGGLFMQAHASQHALGTNIAAPDGTVFTLTSENGQTVRRPYTSAGAFLSYAFNTWSSVVPASAEDLALPVGSLTPPQNGKIICSDRGTDKDTCYLITSGKKAGFTSAQVFTGLGYSFDRVAHGDVSFLNSTANIDSSTSAHGAGTLVNNNGTVYLVGTTGLVGVPSVAALESWGYSLADVVPANSADTHLSSTGVLNNRQPEQLDALSDQPKSTTGATTDITSTTNSSPASSTPASQLRVGQLVNKGGTVYLVGDNGLLGIPDLATFNSWCFSFSNVLPANQAETASPQVSVLVARAVGQTVPSGVFSLKTPTCPASTDQTQTGSTSASSTSSSVTGSATVPTIGGPSVSQPGAITNYNFVSWDQSAGYNGGLITYLVNWGDGSYTSSSSTHPTGLLSGTSFSTSHIWTSSGVYSLSVTATPAQGNASTATLQVTVSSPASSGGSASSSGTASFTPVITLTSNPTALTLTAEQGQKVFGKVWVNSDSTQAVNVEAVGDGTAWLSLDGVQLSGSTAGSVYKGGPNTYYIWVYADATSLTPGTYTAHVTINSPANTLTIPVTFTVTQPAPPPPAPGARVGQLIDKNGTVYYVGNGVLLGVPDLATLDSWGFTFSQVQPANSAEQGLEQNGVIPSRLPGCILGTNTPLDQLAGTCGATGASSN